MNLDQLLASKVKIVEVFTSKSNFCFIKTAYDLDGQVYKIEDDTLWVNEISLTRRPNSKYEPKWVAVLSSEDVKEVVVKSWPEKEIVEKTEIQ